MPPTTILELETLPQFVFDKDSEVTSSGIYYRPKISNYESIDSFELPNRLFQMTSARNRPCKQAGIHKVLNLLGNPSDPCLYFVVPKGLFSDYKFQNYEYANGKTMPKPTYGNVKRVKQFALAIDIVRPN